MELLWRDSLQCPTEEQYISMVNNSEYLFHGVELESNDYSSYELLRDRRASANCNQAHDGMCKDQRGCVRAILTALNSRSPLGQQLCTSCKFDWCIFSDSWRLPQPPGLRGLCEIVDYQPMHWLSLWLRGSIPLTRASQKISRKANSPSLSYTLSVRTPPTDKFSVSHLWTAFDSNSKLVSLDVLQKRPKTLPLKVHAIQYMKEQTKSFEYTLSVMSKLEAQARAEIHRLGNNDALNNIMDILHVE